MDPFQCEGQFFPLLSEGEGEFGDFEERRDQNEQCAIEHVLDDLESTESSESAVERILPCKEKERIIEELAGVSSSYKLLIGTSKKIKYLNNLYSFVFLQLGQIQDSCSWIDRMKETTQDRMNAIEERCADLYKFMEIVMEKHSEIFAGIFCYDGENPEADARRSYDRLREILVSVQKTRMEIQSMMQEHSGLKSYLYSITMRKAHLEHYQKTAEGLRKKKGDLQAEFDAVYAFFIERKNAFNSAMKEFLRSNATDARENATFIVEATKREYGDYESIMHEAKQQGITSLPQVVKSSAFGSHVIPGCLSIEEKTSVQEKEKEAEGVEETMSNLIEQIPTYSEHYKKHVENAFLMRTNREPGTSIRVTRDESNFKAYPKVHPVLLLDRLPTKIEAARHLYPRVDVVRLDLPRSPLATKEKEKQQNMDVTIFSSKKRLPQEVFETIESICIRIVERGERVLTQEKFKALIESEKDKGFDGKVREVKKGRKKRKKPENAFATSCTLCRNTFVDEKFKKALLEGGKEAAAEYAKKFKDRRTWPTYYGTPLCGCETIKKCLWCMVVSWMFYGNYRMNRYVRADDVELKNQQLDIEDMQESDESSSSGKRKKKRTYKTVRKRNNAMKATHAVKGRCFEPLVDDSVYPQTTLCTGCYQYWSINDLVAVETKFRPQWKTQGARKSIQQWKEILDEELKE